MPQNDAKNKLLDESMQRAMAKVLAENPDVKPVTVSPRSSSMLTSMMMPRGAEAVTNPFNGNITYNPEMMEGKTPFDLEQTLSHELTHSRQAQTTPWWKTAAGLFQPDEKVPQGIPAGSNLDNSYYWRPRELEAFQTEKDRAMRMGHPISDPMTGSMDLQLPSMRGRGINTAPTSGKLAKLAGRK